MKLYVLSTALIALAFACNSKQPATTGTGSENASTAQAASIRQPLEHVGPTSQVFTFNNAKGMVKRSSRNSLISIPENAFVMADGTPVKGEVAIEFKEIFNPAEIILSGIPMNVVNKGQTTPFISDGMFSIEASCAGKTVGLAEGKTISVSTPSEKAEKDFDYWYFNETSGTWENIGDRNATHSEQQIIEKSKEVNPVQSEIYLSEMRSNASEVSAADVPAPAPEAKPQAPASYSRNDFVFNITASYKDYPELAMFKSVLWKPVQKLEKQQQEGLVTGMQSYGANVTLECKDREAQVYTIRYGSSSVDAQPVLLGADKEKAAARYKEKLAVYEKKLKEAKDAGQQSIKAYNSYAKTYNMFAVNQMGIYNCDRFYSYGGQKDNYTFRCEDDPVNTYVFAVLKNNQGVIALSSAYMVGDYYKLPTKEITGFVHTDSEGGVSYAKNNPETAKDQNDITLTTYRKPIEEAADLQALIQSF